jgi:hypothetical protein
LLNTMVSRNCCKFSDAGDCLFGRFESRRSCHRVLGLGTTPNDSEERKWPAWTDRTHRDPLSVAHELATGAPKKIHFEASGMTRVSGRVTESADGT